MIFGSRCAGCRTRGPVLCRTCRFALVSRPMFPAPDGVVVATAYTGRVRAVLLGFKYDNRRPVSAHIAGILSNRIEEVLATFAMDARLDTVTWAPTSPARRRRRGFDQAELVARGVAARLGLPCRQLLERRGGTAAQTGRTRHERLHAPQFVAHPRAASRRVVVIDDVVTTGATLRAAASALRAAGATLVLPAAFAATPAALRTVELVA